MNVLPLVHHWLMIQAEAGGLRRFLLTSGVR